jgi:hypothetical protein
MADDAKTSCTGRCLVVVDIDILGEDVGDGKACHGQFDIKKNDKRFAL